MTEYAAYRAVEPGEYSSRRLRRLGARFWSALLRVCPLGHIFQSKSLRILAERITQKEIGTPPENVCYSPTYRGGGHLLLSYTEEGDITCDWWLRTYGGIYDYASGVNDDGSLDYGRPVHCEDGVRPVIWVDVDAYDPYA